MNLSLYKNFIFFVLLIGTIISPASFAQGMGQQECDSLTVAAASMMNNRHNGATKQSVLNSLPSLDQPSDKKESAKYILLTELHQMAHEVFAHAAVDATVYMIFKSETCLKKIQGKTHVSYHSAHPLLEECSKMKSNDKRVKCSTDVAHSVPN